MSGRKVTEPQAAGDGALIRRRVFRATSTNFLSRIAIFAVRFFVTPFIVHRLGDVQFGLWALVSSVVGQGEILDLGIRNAVTKYVAEHHPQGEYDRARQLIATSLCLYAGIGLLVVFASAALAPVFPHIFNVPVSDASTASTVVLLMGLQIGFTLPGSAPGAVLWGLHKYHLVNLLILTSTILSAGLIVAVLLAGGGVIEMVAVTVPVTVVLLIIGMVIFKRMAPELYPRWQDIRRGMIRPILSFSGATFIIETAYGLQMKADEAIIGATLPISAVSPYSIARRLSALPQTLAQQSVGVFLPIASELDARGSTEQLRALYINGSRITLAMCTCFSVILITLAAPLLTLWVGAQYAQYAPIVTVLALAGLAEISHWVGGIMLQGIARHRTIAIAHVCAAIANLALSIALVRHYGLIGVAFGTLIPSTVLSVCFVWPYASRVLGVPGGVIFRDILLPAFLPVVPMLAVIYGALSLIEVSGLVVTIATVGVAGAVYVATYLVWGAGDTERAIIRANATRLRHIMGLSARSRENDQRN